MLRRGFGLPTHLPKTWSFCSLFSLVLPSKYRSKRIAARWTGDMCEYATGNTCSELNKLATAQSTFAKLELCIKQHGGKHVDSCMRNRMKKLLLPLQPQPTCSSDP